ncbi:MAG: aminotransferase class I/II-fold pyridoxal phosphate-dependent enzyme [Methanogenium sp.]|jgi:aspartate/methionine/tyrosine aminotransferase
MQIPPFALERYFGKYEFTAPYMLSAADCETWSAGEIFAMEEGSLDAFCAMRFNYTETQGNPALRDEISALSGDIGPERCVVFAGAEEAIFLTMHALIHPGDHVIVLSPAYQSLHEIARHIGAEVSYWEMKEEDGWRPDMAELWSLIRPDTRCIVINTPHNPTGFHFSAAELDELIRIAEEKNIWLFSDEVYRFGEYHSSDLLPSVASWYEKGISVGVMSKSFGLAGLRLGWVATQNMDLIHRLIAWKDYTTICTSAPAEFLSTVALRNKDNIIARNRQITKDNRDLLNAFFARHLDLFSCKKPMAGPVCFPRYLGKEGAEAFCDTLIRKAGVILLPETVFGFGDEHIRFGFGRRDMEPALAVLDEYLIKNGL